MILDPNSTVQPETTFTLSHKRAICNMCNEATCMCTLILPRDQFFFLEKQKNFDPLGSSNKTLSRSDLILPILLQLVCN